MSAHVTPLRPGRAGCCDHCGTDLDAVTVVLEGVVRGVVHAYCDPGCRSEHAAAVATTPRACYFCPDDAAGDTGLCARHLDAENAPTTLPLAG